MKSVSVIFFLFLAHAWAVRPYAEQQVMPNQAMQLSASSDQNSQQILNASLAALDAIKRSQVRSSESGSQELRSDPAKYYDRFGDTNPKVVSDKSCKSWRVEPWQDKQPSHQLSEVETNTFILGIGPPKTASSFTFSTVATNPNICFWREKINPDFSETHALFGDDNGIGDLNTGRASPSFLLSHLAPADCCRAVVMKAPGWAMDSIVPYEMKQVFKANPNVKFVLTIREPSSALASKFNFMCTDFGKPWNYLQTVCKQDGRAYVDNIEEDSRKRHDCFAGVLEEGLQGRELAEKLSKCKGHTPLAVQNYDYEAIFNRYADLFGGEKIMCHFLTDLISLGGDRLRRSLFDFAGLTDVSETDVKRMETHVNHRGPKTFTLNDAQLHNIQQIVAKYNTGGSYSESRLRSMCVKVAGH